MRKIVLLGLIACCFSTNVYSSNIEQFLDPQLVEVFDSGDAVDPTKDKYALPKPPVKVQGKKHTRIAFNIGDKTYWIEAVDVQLSDRIKIESICNDTQLTTNYTDNHYGIRGAGIGCKK